MLGALSGLGCARRRPSGPNDAYRDPRVTAQTWNHYFEDDGRGEIFQKRDVILKLAGVKPGMSVADVGAGTGLFSMMLANAVGPAGRVYAEEVVDRFSRYIAERAARERRANVVSVVGTETGVGLPSESVDLAFLCDVYHHFDHPAQMLASIRQALRSNGELFLVDFRRDPRQESGLGVRARARRRDGRDPGGPGGGLRPRRGGGRPSRQLRPSLSGGAVARKNAMKGGLQPDRRGCPADRNGATWLPAESGASSLARHVLRFLTSL